jgi:hypothetical protein
MPARPFERSLGDFGRPTYAEQELLQWCRRGVDCVIAKDRPAAHEKNADNIVRARFLRFLILGGDDENPVHERGIYIQGAWIDGELNLEGGTSTGNVSIFSCWFDQTPILRDAHVKGNLFLSGSRVPGLNGDRLICDASLFCRNDSGNKFISDGEFRLLGAEIHGSLFFRGATLNGPSNNGKPAGKALDADGIRVNGSVFLNHGFKARGEVWMVAAVIGGDLECTGATLNGPLNDGDSAGNALNAARIAVKGNVVLDDNFTANGEVRLLGAVIGGDLNCANAAFNLGAGFSILAEGMSVAGAFFFRRLRAPAAEVNLAQARVRVLHDDQDAWGGDLILEGFTYERIGGTSPTEARMRLDWLDKQRAKGAGKSGKTDQFWPQPWVQLRKVLQEEGHAEDARKVGIAFEKRRRKCGQIGGFWPKLFHQAYGFFTGYGYRPMRLLVSSLVVWIFCGLIYDFAAHHNVFAPTDSLANYEMGCTHSAAPRTECTAPELSVFHPPFNGNYPTFHPFAYSLNVFLPVINLGQEAAWAPIEKPFSQDYLGTLFNNFTNFGSIVQLLIWLETLFGWIAGLLLVAVVSGLARKQDES